MWLSSLSVVLPDRVIANGALRIQNDVIAEISEVPNPAGLDCKGALVMPGFIDMHGDMIEIEIEPRAGVDFPMEIALAHLDARLAASGITTAYAAVSFSRGAVSGERRSFEHTSRTIRTLHGLRDRCAVDHKIHARFDITFDNAVEVLADLIRDQQVDLVSVMDHTPGQGQYRDIERHISMLAAREGVSEVEARQIVTTRIAERTRPQSVILGNVQAVSKLCAAHGVPLASHDDDTREKAHLMADVGAVISEFPVTLEAAEVAAERGLMTAMGAPNAMRGKSYSGNLSAREAHTSGLLDILASDYHPASMLAAVMKIAETDPNGIAGAAALITSNPAKALGLTDRGRIEVGLKADLAFVEHGAMPRVVATMRNGRFVHAMGVLDFAPKSDLIAAQ
ncbi:alpha-D-ribose 1-methylphosphonate 5-triphosphate diphosphatase [Aliiroseovarius halocynthiae]|uniref:Alpha-D-ribose 1-methylphosphonate 5-triphosphate diphosphatase n=1 Tax=Aliiroseovarius halocynthiae TaxID=985055 RepID=A0A545SQX7_9RHOB|nr:alpha-D-ribose 1-methylphosphonate 5-triphosphate diphosphatase [Aliiroseovarius halocynthiae]TQV67371.1 alpha-D-ribose 1-methylphosphonate 5-triphosphate diphosphatase [Aliiroseovarius halocynthiae]SMR81282.1 alpha-D-ribose 1-methylphosphonate 5-triphosphate diphosphatase [Aliiroseovarius halocynthiae]